MRYALWLLSLALALSCSSSDQSLGETHPAPHPIIDPQPQPNPSPDPAPTRPPCEDSTRHAVSGTCLPASVCKAHVLTVSGYECNDAALVCCNNAPGCSPTDCGDGGKSSSGGSGGSVISQGAEAGNADAGAGGKP